MTKTYLSTAQLAQRLPYTERTIRDTLKDVVLLEGIHYIRPFGRRKIFYIWEAIEADLAGDALSHIPMANGGLCHG